MHSSYGEIPVYFNQHIVKRPNMRQTLLVVGVSWFRWPGSLFWFLSCKTPIPSKEMNTLHHLVSFWGFYWEGGDSSPSQFDYNMCSASHPQLGRRSKREGMARRGMKLATHAGSAAADQSVRRKLWKIPIKGRDKSTQNICCEKDDCCENPACLNKVTRFTSEYCCACKSCLRKRSIIRTQRGRGQFLANLQASPSVVESLLLFCPIKDPICLVAN